MAAIEDPQHARLAVGAIGGEAAVGEVERDLDAAVEKTKAFLAEYQGVIDIDDDSRPGKWEYQMKVKPRAEAMGVSLSDVASTIRASFYGEECRL